MFPHTLFDLDCEINYNNMAEQKTLRQLVAPNVNYNALCIEYPKVVTLIA